MTETSFIFVDWEGLIFNDRVVLDSGGIFVIFIEEFDADAVLGLNKNNILEKFLFICWIKR